MGHLGTGFPARTKSAELDEDGDFGRLVVVLAATGARFSQGEADDVVAADGDNILSWAQALDKALAWVKRQRNADPVADAKITVAQAIELYTGARDDRDSKRAGRSIRSDASSRLTLPG